MICIRKVGTRVNFFVAPIIWAICGMFIPPFIIGVKFWVTGHITVYTPEVIKYLLAIGLITSVG